MNSSKDELRKQILETATVYPGIQTYSAEGNSIGKLLDIQPEVIKIGMDELMPLIDQYVSDRIIEALQTTSSNIQKHIDKFTKTADTMAEKRPGMEWSASALKANALGKKQVKRIIDEQIATLKQQQEKGADDANL